MLYFKNVNLFPISVLITFLTFTQNHGTIFGSTTLATGAHTHMQNLIKPDINPFLLPIMIIIYRVDYKRKYDKHHWSVRCQVYHKNLKKNRKSSNKLIWNAVAQAENILASTLSKLTCNKSFILSISCK